MNLDSVNNYCFRNHKYNFLFRYKKRIPNHTRIVTTTRQEGN